jgi:hypothetical protein
MMTETRQAALDRLSGRAVPAATPPPKPIGEAPKIAHYPVGRTRPIIAPLPSEPIRVTRAGIEAALVGSFTYNPHTEEIIDRIALETAQMDQHPPCSDPFREHEQTILRLLRQLGPYPMSHAG